LTRMFPGSQAVGEESIAEEPSLLERLSDGVVWLIDPIDGTASFVRGASRFSTLVALCIAGATVASWVHVPLARLMMTARKGQGTYLNGRQLRVAHTMPSGRLCVTVTDPQYQTPADHIQIARLRAADIIAAPCDGVGLAYIALAAGESSAAVFGWDSPWDHAAGLLAHAEAGGVQATAAGDAFRLTGGNQLPLAVAADQPLLQYIHTVIHGEPQA
jgi:fructose-1,6-bisphosphatase/inositol monophosphatase family enzyme